MLGDAPAVELAELLLYCFAIKTLKKSNETQLVCATNPVKKKITTHYYVHIFIYSCIFGRNYFLYIHKYICICIRESRYVCICICIYNSLYTDVWYMYIWMYQCTVVNRKKMSGEDTYLDMKMTSVSELCCSYAKTQTKWQL